MKTLILIFCLFASLSYSQGIQNQYGTITGGMKQISGATVVDLKGTSNGTIGGTSTAPTISTNGYISFTGANGTTTGDRGRVNLHTNPTTRTSFDYAYNSSFTQVLIFRSSKNDAVAAHYLYSNRLDSAAGTNNFALRLNANEGLDFVVFTNSGQSKIMAGAVNVCDGKWHIAVMSYDGSVLNGQLYAYIDGVLYTNTTTNNITSGNFYLSNNKVVAGCVFDRNSTGYRYDATADISSILNINSKLSSGQGQEIINEFKLLY